MTLPDKYNRTLFFDEPTHKYTDDLGCEYTSTTTVIHKYEIPFDSKAWAKRLAREGKGQYSGKTASEIEAQWATITDDACTKGSATHNKLEDGVKQHSKFKDAVQRLKLEDNNKLYTIDDIIRNGLKCKLDVDKFAKSLNGKYPKIVKLITFYVENGYSLYAEVGLYDPHYLISGMIDLLAIKGANFVIIDWKTNKDEIKFESGYYKKDPNRQMTDTWVSKNEYLKYPIDNLPNCKGSIYAMQLNVYAKLMELRGFNCRGLVLVQIRDAYIKNQYGMPKTDKNGAYIPDIRKEQTVDTHVMPFYRDEATRIFEHHVNTELKSGVQYSLNM